MAKIRTPQDDGAVILGGLTLIVATLGLVAGLLASGAPIIAGVTVAVLLAGAMSLGFAVAPKPQLAAQTVDETERFMSELDEVEFALEDYRNDVADEFNRINHAVADFHYAYRRLLNRFSADARRLVNKDMEMLLIEAGRASSSSAKPVAMASKEASVG